MPIRPDALDKMTHPEVLAMARHYRMRVRNYRREVKRLHRSILVMQMRHRVTEQRWISRHEQAKAVLKQFSKDYAPLRWYKDRVTWLEEERESLQDEVQALTQTGGVRRMG